VTPLAAGEELATALRTVPDLRVTVGLGQPLIPPVAVVGPPVLSWTGGFCGGEPISSVWTIYLISSLTDFATAQLMHYVMPVATAIEENTDAVVRTATPGIYPSGDQGDLPAYLIEVEMELSDGP
jgi:hypothetical protein